VPDESAYSGPLPPGAQGLTDLARGMQHVALATTDILGQHAINMLNHYVDPVTREPIETRIRLRNGQVMDVPLIALIPPSTLAMKQLKIKMAVSVKGVEVKAHQYDKGMAEVDRSRFHVAFGPSDPDNTKRKRGSEKMIDLEMTFEAIEPPEALHRIIEQFTQYVEPMDESDANKYGVPKNGDHDTHGGAIKPLPPEPEVLDADEPLHEPALRPAGDWTGPDVDPNAVTTVSPQDETQEIELPDDDSVPPDAL